MPSMPSMDAGYAEYGHATSGNSSAIRAFRRIDKTAVTSTIRKSIVSIDQIFHPSPAPGLSSPLLMSHTQKSGDAEPGLDSGIFQ